MFTTNNQTLYGITIITTAGKTNLQLLRQTALWTRRKKIFNVDCKNNFNSNIRSELRAKENEFFPKAFKQIKMNYRILLDHKPSLELTKTVYMETKDLLKLGFDPAYCTNAREDYWKKLWKCCHDFYWHEEGTYITIRYHQGPFNPAW